MKRLRMLLLVVILALLLAGCGEQGLYTGSLAFEGTHTIEDGEVLRGALFVMDGTVTVEQGGRVQDSIFIMGGAVDIQGEVGGDVSIIGGNMQIGPAARVNGSLLLGGGTVERSPEAEIGGEINSGSGVQLSEIPGIQPDPQQRLIRGLVETLANMLLAILLAKFIPRPLGRVSLVVSRHGFVAGAMGVLALLVLPALLVMMAFTVVLIPLTIIGGGTLVLLLSYGMIGIGLSAGQLISRISGWQTGTVGTVVIGTLPLMIAINLVGFIPVVGPIIGLLVYVVGFGAVLLTRLGLIEYTPVTYTEEPGAAPARS